MAHQPAVSVLLTAHKDTYIRDAIASVLAQTFSDLELLLLDDSRGDAIREVAGDMVDPRIRFFPSERLGVAMNHDRGLRAARADRIAIINHDDEWEPSMLADLIGALDETPGAIVAFGDHWVIREDGEVNREASHANTARWGRAGLRPGVHRPFMRLAVRHHAIPIAQCALWDRSAIERIPPWAGDRYDYWLQVELARTGRAAVYLDKKLAGFREHSANLSHCFGIARRLEGERFYRHLMCGHGLGPESNFVKWRYVQSLASVVTWPGTGPRSAIRGFIRLLGWCRFRLHSVSVG
jgi:glycosyltransferase involved in cell wall biosynthesis